MKLQNLSKIIHVLLIFLCFINHGSCTHSFLPEKSGIVLHDQVIIRVGVVLDMDSWIGKSIHSFLTFSITDFYARNNNYRTRIVLHTRDSKGDPSQALSAVHDLLNNIKVQAIIGPDTYLEAKLLAPIADKAEVPIFSFAGSPSMKYPFLFLIKEDELVMSKSIAVVVGSFRLRDVIFLNEDLDYGRETLSYFLESFQDKSIQVSHGSSITVLSTDDQITQELQKIKISHTIVVVVHMSYLLASRVILTAKRLGIMLGL
ncbi:putative periplasmic binding protein-like I [Helianthus anomalus]